MKKADQIIDDIVDKIQAKALFLVQLAQPASFKQELDDCDEESGFAKLHRKPSYATHELNDE